jgi:hypothetical protein
MLNNIINDLRNLEDKEVGLGYFKHIYTNEVDVTMISILDVLENLKPYEIEIFEIYNYCNEEEEEIIEVSANEFLEIEEYEEIKSDNSYNWSSPISNHFNYRIYKSSLYEGIIVEFSVHRYGDVRCNYTEEIYFRFNDEYEFYEALEESNKYFTVEKNDRIYQIEINIFSDCPRIYIEEDDKDIEGYEAHKLLEELLEE